MALPIYYDKDIDLNLIQSLQVGIIGYGAQGRAHALNLRDSKVKVRIGLYKGSSSILRAKDEGFEVLEVKELVQKSDVLMVLLPDELHKEVLEKEVVPFLKDDQIVAFSHGFSVHFNQVILPKGVGVILVAPKGPGSALREEYLKNRGLYHLIAVEQESSKYDAKAVALSYAKANGGGRMGVLETSFKEECESDLFGEQAVLCGGLEAIVRTGFETLIKAGYPEELAYFECVHEVKLVADLLHYKGIEGLREHISNTAEFGTIKAREPMANLLEKRMQKILNKIQNGSFAKDFLLEKSLNYPRLNTERKALKDTKLEQIGGILRTPLNNKD
ncbi:ketol-acid reductoisomerase [Helicobacter cetorum]|uniref:Ketol-acid reductoisomerase (NADP(+)) n=1 Tax=Helicobacter cetorum (strain ATCC BAA-429 / MIT 00-7128) TaxID=182217 RepID=I0EMK5_HELC0|nr:ketol-acid reductoisomerase [Helicobacter cetorum]AFI04174.1 ketol-acid reductoisomerase [Helicobacter cetorum MIT 00-7128]